jgi:NAD(P)-dependent dehydrogenase (short-subunit alcohol dehydrogenase family)
MSGWSEQNVPPLAGKVAVVTGANSGLGLETTRVLTQRGARVIMACRNQDKAQRAREQVLRQGVDASKVQIAALDLADQSSIAAFAEGFDGSQLDLLINNAGLMAVAESRTADGFETQFGVNHLGHFALTLRLLPVLTSTPNARVVTVTSMGHRPGRIRLDDPNFEQGRYGRWTAYFQSKLANMLFAAELGRRFADAGKDTLSLAAHPGYARTELGKDEPRLVARVQAIGDQLFAQSAARGAVPTLRAASDPEARNGQLFGPRWYNFGDAVVETPSSTARDPKLAAALWERSLELVKLAEPAELVR